MLDPGLTVWLDGEAEMEKFGEDVAPTTSVRGIVWVRLPLVAVNVKL